MLGSAAIWRVSRRHGTARRVFTQRLKALAAAQTVSMETKLVPLGVLVCCKACSMDSSPVLLLDDEGGGISRRQIWDHACQELLGREPHEVLVAIHFCIEAIEAVSTLCWMDHAILAAEVLALERAVREIPILPWKLLLATRKAVFATKAATDVFQWRKVTVAWMHPWHHDRLVVLAAISVHGRATSLRIGRHRATEVSILVEIVGIHELWVELVLTQ